ncbi:MAG: hypothetical protein IPP48_16300 [Chitinophagaceae bacterium]|nr:hypothetical protein [Chitinophagaceae bacterium]
MSEILKDKMLLHTATPAKGVWESIAFQLNAADNKEQEADAFFATKLTALEVVPPPMAWNNIAAQFDTEVSQNQSQLASKILAYEVSPPTKVWDKIAAVLNKEVAKVISITQSKKYAPVYKMAAAAVAVLVLGTGLWFALQKNNTTLTNNAEKITAKNNATNNSTSVTPNAADTALLASETQEKKIKEKEVNTKQEKIGNPNSTIKNTEFATTDIIPLTQNPFDNKTEKLQNQSGDVVVDIDLVTHPILI